MENKKKTHVIKQEIIGMIKSGKLSAHAKLPSLKKFADKHNVSRTTVDKVFSELEREGFIRVERGRGAFVHDPGTHKRRLIRNKCISVVFPNMAGQFIPEVLHGIGKVISEQDYYLASFNSLDNLELEKENLRRALEIGSKGILLFPVSLFNSLESNYDIYVEVKKTGIPFVFVDNYPLHLDIDYVVSNDFQGVYDLTKYLVTMGHRKIAFFGGPTHVSSLQERQRGFLHAMDDSGLEADPHFVFPNIKTSLQTSEIKSMRDYSAQSANYLRRILEKKNPPSALLLAFWGCEHIQIMQTTPLHIPDDLSLCPVIVKSEEPANFKRVVQHTEFLEITHSMQPDFELGKKAAEVIIDKINNPGKGLVHIKMDMPLHIGNSVKKIGRPAGIKRKTVSKT